MSELGERVWPEFDGSAATLAVPLGSTEQHGPHLPLSTDTEIASALSRGAAARLGGVVVSPALPFGASGEHQSFPGTLSIGQDAVELVLVELCRSATETFPRVVLVSAHGGNAAPVARAVRRLRTEGRDVHAWTPAKCWRGDAHAGRIETSIMLSHAPALVRLTQAAAGCVEPLEQLMPALVTGGVRAVSANGVLGDPGGASAEEGNRLLSEAIDALVDALRRWPVDAGAWL